MNERMKEWMKHQIVLLQNWEQGRFILEATWKLKISL